ncbi:eisosome protein SEG2-like [Venturia canescens]|uniref:eisosome protein SEG2-like n=1 Tax=Venturia canescens TaxID=32260 RepID=UPI001C9BCB2B|nr:eisosome protein SEG2-like [Venturia canescens]
MFGDKLKFISLKGYRGNIAVHSKIRRALFNLINDKAEPQISLKAFNGAINKACTNRKTSSTKICIIVNDNKEDDDYKDDDDKDDDDKDDDDKDDDDKDDDDKNDDGRDDGGKNDDDDVPNFDRSLATLNRYNRLARSLSSSPELSHANSRTPSRVTVEEQEDKELLRDNYQSNLKKGLSSTDLDNSLHLDRLETILLNPNNSMYPQRIDENTLEVDIPLTNSNEEQSTITLICSKSIVQHQSAVESTFTPIHPNIQEQFNNISTATSSNSNPYPQQPLTTITTISGAHSDVYVEKQPINVPITSSTSESNLNPASQPTVASVTAPTYPHNLLQQQITNAPSVSSTYGNQYSQNQSNTTTVNSYSYPQQQSTVVPTNSPTYLSSHTQNQFVTHFDSYYQNNQQMNGPNVPAYNHPHFYNQSQHPFAGYYAGPQWYQSQQSFAPHCQNQPYQHEQNFKQTYTYNNL